MDTTPGTRLRHLRELLGYKGRQQEFADAVGLTQQSISNMERDKTQPASKSVNKIFVAFPQVNISWLVSGQGQPLSEGKEQATPVAQQPAPQPAPFFVAEQAPAYGCIAPDQVAALTLEVTELRAENKTLQAELRQARKEAREDLLAQARTYNSVKEDQSQIITRLYNKLDEYELLLGYRKPTAAERQQQEQQAESGSSAPRLEMIPFGARYREAAASEPQAAVDEDGGKVLQLYPVAELSYCEAA